MDKWILTTERLESQILFLNSWFDATLILVDQGNIHSMNWFGWSAPFDAYVWIAIALTVVFSSVFMMLIDHLERARDDRSWKTWIGDHLYLSSITFSQNFTYEKPRSGAGRIFLSTFSFWSMLIGATYTANLASLLVDNAYASKIDSIKTAMEAQIPICIHDGSASQTIVKAMFPRFRTYDKVVKALTPTDMYEKVAAGECDILVGTRQEFEIMKVQEKYGCNLVQAGPELHSGSASFAIKFDPLRCDSVLAYVLNIHLHEMSIDGNMTKFWNDYIDGIDGTCAKDELQGQRRLAEMNEHSSMEKEKESDSFPRRHLGKVASAASAAVAGARASATDADASTQKLNISGMSGVFLIHAIGTAVSLVMVCYTHGRRKFYKEPKLRRIAQQAEMENSRIMSERKMKMDPALFQKYQDLKSDFMSQLDALFEEHMDHRQKVQSAASSYETEPVSEEYLPLSRAYPSMKQTAPGTNSTSSTSGFGMDSSNRITTSVSFGADPSKRVSRIGMDGRVHTTQALKEEKADAKAYHKSTLSDVSERSEDGMGSGKEKLQAKAYHRSTRKMANDNESRNGTGVIQSMGSGKAALKEAKAYHLESRLNTPSLHNPPKKVMSKATVYQPKSLRSQSNISEDSKSDKNAQQLSDTITDSFRSL